MLLSLRCFRTLQIKKVLAAMSLQSNMPLRHNRMRMLFFKGLLWSLIFKCIWLLWSIIRKISNMSYINTKMAKQIFSWTKLRTFTPWYFFCFSTVNHAFLEIFLGFYEPGLPELFSFLQPGLWRVCFILLHLRVAVPQVWSPSPIPLYLSSW